MKKLVLFFVLLFSVPIVSQVTYVDTLANGHDTVRVQWLDYAMDFYNIWIENLNDSSNATYDVLQGVYVKSQVTGAVIDTILALPNILDSSWTNVTQLTAPPSARGRMYFIRSPRPGFLKISMNTVPGDSAQIVLEGVKAKE